MLVLEANDLIVGKAYDDHIAVRLGVAPSLDPQIARVMQIDVGKDWGNHRTLRGADLTTRYASIFDDAYLQPLRNQAQDALVRDTVLEKAEDPCVGHGIKRSIYRLPIATIFLIMQRSSVNVMHLSAAHCRLSEATGVTASSFLMAPGPSFRRPDQ